MSSRPPLSAGMLRHPITIQQPSRTGANELGEATTKTTSYPAWAAIRPLSSREIVNASALGLNVTHEVRLRYTPDLTSSSSIVFNGRTFNIASLLNVDERNIELVLQCLEVQ